MLDGKSILVTGGTGSFGKAFIQTVLQQYPGIQRLVVFSRDELKQFEMAQEFSKEKYNQIRYFLGDVRDLARLRRAMENIDIVIHAAALKQVPAAEYNPFEYIKTNVLGAQNVIEAALDCGVKQIIALSTDKAAAPINLYGATKLCSDKLFVAANNMKGKRDIRFSVVRYGNVMGSRGSVIPFFIKARDKGVVTITDKRMTRFNITLEQSVSMVLYTLKIMRGGEIFVPKIPSYRITDLAEAVAPGCRHEITGIRPGEKLHEEMITETDAFSAVECEDLFIILPIMHESKRQDLISQLNCKPCLEGFSYNSGTNTEWLTVEEIRELIKLHVDSSFKV